MSESLDTKITANPLIVLREEFDDWALLFNPDTGNTFALNPMGVFIWKILEQGELSSAITRKVCESTQDAPPDAEKQVEDFVLEIVRLGLARKEGERDS